ncbi:MAG TPA: TerB family tellurite resistance protein [Puia sp.]
MIKLFLTIGLLCGAGSPSSAQSIADLVTQLVLDTEKLTSMKSELQELYKGYEVLDKGYTNIRNIAEGNFNLHKLFLDGLLAVSPAVQRAPRILDILNAEYSLLSEYKAASVRYPGGGPFTAEELEYIIGVYSTLLQRSLQSLEELTMVITADQLRMSDAQRLQVIDRVYTAVNGQLAFLRQFDNGLAVQAAQRTKETNTINALKSLYGLPH